MSASSLAVKDAAAATQQLATDLVGGKHTPFHHDADRQALLDAITAVVTALTTIDGRVDGLEGLATGLNGYVDGLEALLGTTNTALTGIAGYVDGLEALATLLNGYVDGLEGKDDALKASVDALLAAIKPATGHFLVSPSGTALSNPTRRILVLTAGNLTCRVGGVDVTYAAPAGLTIDVVATHITAAPAGTIGQF